MLQRVYTLCSSNWLQPYRNVLDNSFTKTTHVYCLKKTGTAVMVFSQSMPSPTVSALLSHKLVCHSEILSTHSFQSAVQVFKNFAVFLLTLFVLQKNQKHLHLLQYALRTNTHTHSIPTAMFQLNLGWPVAPLILNLHSLAHCRA